MLHKKNFYYVACNKLYSKSRGKFENDDCLFFTLFVAPFLQVKTNFNDTNVTN